MIFISLIQVWRLIWDRIIVDCSEQLSENKYIYLNYLQIAYVVFG